MFLKRQDPIISSLIDNDWCEFFKSYGFKIGVSIDGPGLVNGHRIDWQGRETYTRIMRSVHLLKAFGIDFTCIAVISNDSLTKAHDIYQFFCEVGCESFGINLEEYLGTNSSSVDNEEMVKRFWEELFNEWHQNPKVQVREFNDILHWMGSLIGEKTSIPNRTDVFPTIGWDGSVVLLSPELLGAKSAVHADFVVGNILKEDLREILEQGQQTLYVREYRSGVEQCRSVCDFFHYCRGGQAANKFFELGKIAGTETTHCRNSQQRPVKTVLKFLERHS